MSDKLQAIKEAITVKPYYENENGLLYNADCLDILKQIPCESLDMLFTDPPYGHSNHDNDLNAQLNKHRGLENKPIANDTPEDFRMVMDSMLKEAVRLLKTDCCCCCCCCCCGGGGPRPTFAWVANRMDEQGLSFFHSVIWDKRNPGLGWRYRRQHEMIMIAHKDGGRLLWNKDDITVRNVISVMPAKERVHPNEKPLELVMKIVNAHAKEDSLILDPFLGSGTTAVACERLGRKWIGIELSKEYCDIAVKRIEKERSQLKLI